MKKLILAVVLLVGFLHFPASYGAEEPESVPKINFDFEKGGKLKSGLWEYEYGTDGSIQRYGFLRFDSKDLCAENGNDYYETPFGRLYWYGTPKSGADFQWMPYPSEKRGLGKELKVAK